MKSTDFFIKKSESFIEELGLIKLEPFFSDEKTTDIYEESIPLKGSRFNEQKEELNEIKFQMALMYSEFDNGTLFSERLSNYKNTDWFSDEPYLQFLIELNELFIEFLKEYRVE